MFLNGLLLLKHVLSHVRRLPLDQVSLDFVSDEEWSVFAYELSGRRTRAVDAFKILESPLLSNVTFESTNVYLPEKHCCPACVDKPIALSTYFARFRRRDVTENTHLRFLVFDHFQTPATICQKRREPYPGYALIEDYEFEVGFGDRPYKPFGVYTVYN